MRITPYVSLLLVGCALAATASARSEPTATVASVDLKRYMGNWYVIANIPYFLEKNKVASYDSYALLPDGRIENNFTFRKGDVTGTEKTWHGKATIVNKETNAEWKVRFLWPFSSTYLVLDLDPDYQWAVVGTPGRKLVWILARERHLPDELYAKILGRLAYKDFDVAKLRKVPQPSS
jgi:apolipoprotein D and lipocalin family protein